VQAAQQFVERGKLPLLAVRLITVEWLQDGQHPIRNDSVLLLEAVRQLTKLQELLKLVWCLPSSR
jgi:hypothetical protein